MSDGKNCHPTEKLLALGNNYSDLDKRSESIEINLPGLSSFFEILDSTLQADSLLRNGASLDSSQLKKLTRSNIK